MVVKAMEGCMDGWTQYLLGHQRLVGVQAHSPPLLLRFHVDADVSLGVSEQTEAKHV